MNIEHTIDQGIPKIVLTSLVAERL